MRIMEKSEFNKKRRKKLKTRKTMKKKSMIQSERE